MTAPAVDDGDRPRLERRPDSGVAAGVCAGIAAATGVDVALVRIAVLVLTAVGGVGIAVYAVAAAGIPPPRGGCRSRLRDRLPSVLGTGLVVLALLGALASGGLVLPREVLVPATLAAAGAALIWRRAGGEVRVTAGRVGIGAAVRALAGVLLVATGATLVIAQTGGIAPAAAAAVAAGAVAAGIGLLVAPRLRRAREEADEERRERITAEERERVAGRLHDSVLQTLALIQREGDPERARALARRQDRELRAWLYGGEDADAPPTLAAALRGAVADVEQAYGVAVDLVQHADAAMEPRLDAIVEATREAVTNAAKHAGTGRVNVLVQVTPREVRVFVRDRGAGFDPAAVPADRRGLSDSVRGRMTRAGGTAAVDTAPGAGTEVELAMPRSAP